MTFGFTTLPDVLSWVVVIAFAVKILATLIILIINKEVRDQPGWGSALWWATKIAPLVAVPCLIWIALLDGEISLAWLFFGLALFVFVAVPLKVHQRRNRIAKQTRVCRSGEP